VVICTRNRVGLLAECLASVARQEVASGPLEIVVVDNGSRDGTPAWLRAWASEDPDNRRALSEPRAGLSEARNRGAEICRRDVLLFIDDDATAHDGWASAHLERYADERVAALAGRVELDWPAGRPRWLTPELEYWYSALDLGPEVVSLEPPRHPYGANMSVRRRDFLDAGGFAHELGRRARSLVSSEEHELADRLRACGGRIEYAPASVVSHHVIPERLRRRWILRRGWAQGRGNARMQRLAGSTGSARPVVRQEARAATADLGGLVAIVREGSASRALDDVARRSGHLAAVVEHAWLWWHGLGARSPR
jgi:glycosyltransferase involved in cell wall biosynthesis